MRENLFRGKPMNGGEWVEGDLLRAKWYINDIEHHFIFTDAEAYPANEFVGYEEVFPETVGQFTGLIDKNGIRIFEGDILANINRNTREPKVFLQVKDIRNGETLETYVKTLEFEVVGNIHDNPELLEVK